VQCRDECGDAALHIDCAATVKQIALYLGNERVACPASARRHDIKMPGKGEVTPSGFANGKQIFDGRTMRWIVIARARYKTVNAKAHRLQHVL